MSEQHERTLRPGNDIAKETRQHFENRKRYHGDSTAYIEQRIRLLESDIVDLTTRLKTLTEGSLETGIGVNGLRDWKYRQDKAAAQEPAPAHANERCPYCHDSGFYKSKTYINDKLFTYETLPCGCKMRNAYKSTQEEAHE